jgi:hypothetical protein
MGEGIGGLVASLLARMLSVVSVSSNNAMKEHRVF